MGGFINFDRHLDRLQSSSAYFGMRFVRAEARAALFAVTPHLPWPARVRLELRDGAFNVTFEALEPVGPPIRIRLALDDVPVDSGDVRLFHKMTERARYDAAMARHPEADDVILGQRVR